MTETKTEILYFLVPPFAIASIFGVLFGLMTNSLIIGIITTITIGLFLCLLPLLIYYKLLNKEKDNVQQEKEQL